MHGAIKKRRSEEVIHRNLSYRHYQFRTGADTGEALPWEEVIGCDGMKHALGTEIREVLANQLLYELWGEHGKPVQRFLRFYGVPHSSKSTAILSFAAWNRIDVLFVRNLIGFDPHVHLLQIYQHARELGQPVMVVLKNIDSALRTHVPHPHEPGKLIVDPMLSPLDYQRHTRNINMMENCLQDIQQSRYPIWTIMLTDNKRPLPFEVDQFFDTFVYWNGCNDPVDIFSEFDRMRILARCVYRYQDGVFEMNEGEQRELAEHGQFTTFNQIERFVRKAAAIWKRRIPPTDRISLNPTDPRLLITLEDVMEVLRMQSSSISLYPAYEANILPFV